MKVFSRGLTISKECRTVGMLKEYGIGSVWRLIQWVDCSKSGVYLLERNKQGIRAIS